MRPIRTFYILILTQTFSILGSSMTGLAIGIKVYDDTGQVTPLALVAFFSQLPRIISVSFAGVLTDRWDRRKVMMLADAGQAFGTLLLLLSFASGDFQLWHLYAVAIFQAIFETFQYPAFQASVTMLVPDEKRDLANAIQQITGPLAGVIAPIIAGFLFVLVDVTGVMAIDLVTFMVAIIVVAFVHIPRPTETEEGRAAKGSVVKEALSGFKFLLERRTLFHLILYAMLLNFLFNMTFVARVPYILAVTDNEATLGVILAAMSAGPLVGGVLFGMWKRNIGRVHVIFIAIILMGAFTSLYGMMRSPLLLALTAFLWGFPNPSANASLMSLMQIKTPPDMQGRVFSAILQIAMLATPIAYLISGPLIDEVLEPATGTTAWEIFEPIVGNQAGAGMGLLAVVNGSIVVITGLALYSRKRMRQLEHDLPDYMPAIVTEEVESKISIPVHGEPAPAT